MKKFVLGICVIVMLVMLIGCGKNKEEVNSVSGDNFNQEISGDNQEILEDANSITDKMYWEDKAYSNFFNVAFSSFDSGENFYNDNYEFESDGKKYVLSAKRKNKDYLGINLLINGEEFEPVFGAVEGVAVIDIDKNDDSKEIIMAIGSDGSSTNVLYKIDTNGKLVEYFDDEKMIEKEPCYFNGKFIIPVFLVSKAIGPIIGYYEYDGGEFKYVDKCLTGEKSTNESGDLIEEIQNEIFYCNTELRFIRKDEKEIKSNASFKILRVRFELNEENEYERKFDIELLEDAIWGDDKSTETLPKGTVLEDVNYIYLYC